MNILLFGGSFDPIHKGHIELLKHVSQCLKIDQVILIPAQNAHFGKQIIAGNKERLAMMKLALKDYPNWVIDEFEISQPNNYHSYTHLTIEHFKSLYPHDQLFFLIGSDQLLNFDQWQQPLKIAAAVQLVVVSRQTADLDLLLQKYHALLINDFSSELSSTIVRNQLIITQLPNPEVYQYIINHGLYHQCWLANRMQHERYLHVVRVAALLKQTLNVHAPELVTQGWIAGLYHDIAKNYSHEQLLDIYQHLNYPPQPINVLHGPVAAYVLTHDFGLQDQMVLNAITRHTMPYAFIQAPLSILDQALYCCDKLEINRTVADIENITYFRELLKRDLAQCFLQLFAQLNALPKPGDH